MAVATRLQTGPGVRRYANTYLYIYTMRETTPKTQPGPTHAWWAAFSMSSSATLLVIFLFSRTERPSTQVLKTVSLGTIKSKCSFYLRNTRLREMGKFLWRGHGMAVG